MLPNPVDGATLADARALVALRVARGEALITVKGGNFAGADLRGARLHNICFLDTVFAGSDWRGADAPGIGFVRADLAGARLAGARMPQVLLRVPNLENADASDADFSGGRLDGGWDGSLQNLRLDRANLAGFRFECGIALGDGCPLDRHLSLRGADLSGAALDTYVGTADWAGARIDRTALGLSQLAEIRAANVAGPILLRGGDSTVELSPADYASLLPHILWPAGATSPSFECTPTATLIELQVCRDEAGMLQALDRTVAGLYQRASASDPGIVQSQRAWLRERDRCAQEGDSARWCVQQSYERRKAELIARIGPPDWARPGAVASFVDPRVEFDEAFRAGPLYRRLVPVIVGGAWSRVRVRVNGDGTIDARGDATGANAHMCDLGGEGLRFDPATGWYSGPFEATGDEPAEWRTAPMPVLLLWDERAQVYQSGHSGLRGEDSDPRSSDYASCGARAGFDEMLRMPLSEAEEATLRRELDQREE